MTIQDTGVRGYLKWLQEDQPGIYQQIAPQLAQQVPEAFSDYEQSRAMGSLMGLADDGVGFDTSGWTTETLTSRTPDVASAANQGASSSGIVSTIANLVGAAGQIFLAKSQVDTLKQVNNIQLQRAQLGLAPLDMSTYRLGVPQVNLGLSSGTLTGGGIALAVVAGLGLMFALSGRKRARA